jgi:hypothetical protein
MEDALIKQAKAGGLICVTLDIHLWSGRKRLRKEALLAKNPEFADLPPESLATLGSIKIADPDDLAPFSRLKREGETLLQRSGLPFLGTIGIPEGKVDKVYTGLTDLKTQFDAKRAQLHRDFEARIMEWREKDDNKDWAHLINDVPTPEYVAGALSFGFHMCRVLAPSDDEFAPVNANYGRQMSGLKGELFADAAREARVLMERYLTTQNNSGVAKPREHVTHKTLGPLRRVAEKMRSFSFLDPSVAPLAEVIEHVLALLPKEGPIDGVHLVHIWTLARTLANEGAAEEAAMLALTVASPSLAFEGLMSKSADTVSAPAEPASAPAPAPGPSAPAPVPRSDAPAGANAPTETFEPSLVGLF